ncbi:unnamed protein product, partial [Ectocarpus sp. 8 AP-2014]
RTRTNHGSWHSRVGILGQTGDRELLRFWSCRGWCAKGEADKMPTAAGSRRCRSAAAAVALVAALLPFDRARVQAAAPGASPKGRQGAGAAKRHK